MSRATKNDAGRTRSRNSHRAIAGQTRPRRLLLCLDGVPYELMKAAKERGLFDKFRAPVRLLSPFPTMTNIALSAMLGASVPLGYETIYFDRTGDLDGVRLFHTFLDELNVLYAYPPMLRILAARHKVALHILYKPPTYLDAPQNAQYLRLMTELGIEVKTGSLRARLRQQKYDAVLIATPHSLFRNQALYARAQLVVDTRNIVEQRAGGPKVVRA